MRLKTFIADSMSKAMDLVRREMGENAIIVATQSAQNGRSVRLTAALEDDIARERQPVPAFDGDDDDDSGEAVAGTIIRQALAYHNVSPPLSARLLAASERYVGAGTVAALGGAIDELFLFQPIVERLQVRPLMLVGPPGAGKTIAAAKILTRARRCGRAVAAITADIKRAGGIEQLQAFTQILAVPFTPVGTADELTAALPQQNGTLAIIDTAGTNPFAESEMNEMMELALAAAAEPVLVLSAGGDPVEAAEIGERFAAAGVRRLLATRLDVSRRLGGLLAVADAGQLAFADVSVNAEIASGLAPINPMSLARLLIPDFPSSGSTPQPSEAS
jgi:flagellar biosynthesis protein FlhF